MATAVENPARSTRHDVMPARAGMIKVVLFCGGRGSASIIRSLIQLPSVDLSLLINAYDDGLSTGDLRAFIPGMLGPSDFRKNLSYLIDLYSEGQYALQKLIEYRLPEAIEDAQITTLHAFAEDRAEASILLPEVAVLLAQLDRKTLAVVKGYLARFFDYAVRQSTGLKYGNCSLGNLVFAGAYLSCNNDFNQTNHELAHMFGSQAKLVNVCSGASRTLVAVKEDGDVLSREAEVVGEQSASPIHRFFFVDQPLTPEDVQALSGKSLKEKERYLSNREILPEGSREAIDAIRQADVIIFGPGTQHSSLLPSYRIKGIGEALQQSNAAIKAFVVNLQTDHDILAFDTQGLVDTALRCMGDPDNTHRVITHILYNTHSQTIENGIRLADFIRDAGMVYKQATVVEDSFQNPIKPKVHSGSRIISHIFDLYYRNGKSSTKETLDIYVDLVDRSVAIETLVQEFAEIEWQNAFEKVTLILNAPVVGDIKLPAYLSIRQTGYATLFSEVSILREWLTSKTGDYLVTLTGDGEYALRDIFLAHSVISFGHFGAVYGSRTQSRHQFHASLRTAYGENTFLYGLSFAGAFVLSTIFALMYGRIFTDPLTGFRLYRRRGLPADLMARIKEGKVRSAAAVTRELARQGTEIAEIPVHYRTFREFSKASWRLARGLRNLSGIFG